MTYSSVQRGFSAGEISPRLWGRTDLAKYAVGCSTLRNAYVDYRGGASSRAGFKYVGMCKQGAPNDGGTSTDNPPRDIPFQFSISQGYALEFGDQYMRIKSDGAYVVEAAKNITSATQTDPIVITSVAHGYSDDDWVFFDDVGGMTELNGQTWIVANKTADTFELTDLFGTPLDSSAFGVYTSGGTAQRIYTVVSPYAAIDLPFLKYTQSADTMTLTCVNQQTNTEYPSYELVRSSATSWAFTADTFATSIAAPTGLGGVGYNSTTLDTYYMYVVTSVSAATGEESIASASLLLRNNNISINAGTNNLSWNPVSGASYYNVYAATPSYNAIPSQAAATYGFVGTAFGPSFIDTNIVPDFTTTPPIHTNPFARSPITMVWPSAVGSSYSASTVGYTITTSTGSGAVILPVVSTAGAVVAYIVQNGGKSYVQGDTITITSSAGGAGATAALTIGDATGTYPGTCAYFQQRRAYGYSLDQPDTYWMSQPGAFNNMDSSIPATDSDSITGSPWAQQINGIQFLVPMPGGLVILTGKGAWQLSGGSNNAALTPIEQQATPQAYNGCHFYVPPIVVNYDILYVQAKGCIVRDLSYNFFVNIYTGTDMTVLSEHLFNFHQIQQWAYAEEPYKIVWSVRDDGVLLSLTYLKEQDVYGWARHDTNGIFIGVCSVTEPPVDAVYVITKRYIAGEEEWAYYSERADNRNWLTVEDCFCVDAGLSLPLTYPAATLMPDAADGDDNISAINLAYGGSGYTNPTVTASDPSAQGSGFAASLLISGGVITGYVITNEGTGYQPGTELIVSDPDGSGAVLYPVLTNIIDFTTSASITLTAGDVIRIGNNNAAPLSGTTLVPNGGGKIVVTTGGTGTSFSGDVVEAITNILPNDPNDTPIPVSSGYWSSSTPVTSITGLRHLEGMEVSILADGSVVAKQTVEEGEITLPAPYSNVTVGLGFAVQVQTLYLDAPIPGGTIQGKRKNVQAVTARVEKSRGLWIGANMPDASIYPNGQAPDWEGLFEMKQRNPGNPPGTAIPLFSGDLRELISGQWDKGAQIAVQVTDPLPCNLLAVIPEWSLGETDG